jgi:hypothetical protein
VGRDGIRARRETLKWRTRIGIARLASRLSEVQSSGTPSDGATMRIFKVPFGGCVSYYYVIGVVSSFSCLHINLEERG